MNDDYKIKYIRTKNKIRKIITYNSEEKRNEHLNIAKKIENNFQPSIFSKGYVKEESIYTNAKAHLYNDYFIKTDIKDFFNTINHNLLKRKIYKELEEIISPKDCELLVKKCSVSDKGLPLGLITSPILSNIYLKDFDMTLYKKLKRIDCENIIYTRYADDIIISFKKCKSPFNIYKRVINIIEDILEEYHMKLNISKTKFIDFNKGKQVKITGISIVEKNGIRRLSIGRNNKRKLFYEALNFKKNNNIDIFEKKRLKGKMSFYLSVEKTNFDDFLSDNMKKELEIYNCNTFIEFMNKL